MLASSTPYGRTHGPDPAECCCGLIEQLAQAAASACDFARCAEAARGDGNPASAAGREALRHLLQAMERQLDYLHTLLNGGGAAPAP
jgi:hypothetical protein